MQQLSWSDSVLKASKGRTSGTIPHACAACAGVGEQRLVQGYEGGHGAAVEHAPRIVVRGRKVCAVRACPVQVSARLLPVECALTVQHVWSLWQQPSVQSILPAYLLVAAVDEIAAERVVEIM